MTKMILGAVALAGIAYFVYFVQLGDKSLWVHLKGISQTTEAKHLQQSIATETEALSHRVSLHPPKEEATVPSSSDEAPSRRSESAPKTNVTESRDKGNSQKPGSVSVTLSAEDKRALERLLKNRVKQPLEQ